MKNLWNDDLTQSIASTVSDVLEGKVKEEEMDPKDHVKQNKDGGYDVVDVEGKVVKNFGKKDEAEGYAIKNHKSLMSSTSKAEAPAKAEPKGDDVDPVKEVEEPRAKGEKGFKMKHKVKKSGEKEDGTVVKEAEEVTISIDYMHKIDEKLKPGRGKETVDIDYIGDKKLTKKMESKFKIKIKQTGQTTADVTGEKKNVLAFMQSDAYLMDDGDIKELFPELLEHSNPVAELGKETGYLEVAEEDLSPAQKKYQAFFKKVLKKFNVDSPAELKGDKKKEFFDYIDKNYEAEDESD